MIQRINGKIVDIVERRIFDGTLTVEDGKIKNVEKDVLNKYDKFIIPGFIDSHIHIESSMLVPSFFAKLAVKFGTVGVVADPHEIANVLGVEGVDFMIKEGKRVPFKFYFSVPSCVPSTSFETSGARIDDKMVGKMIKKDEFHFLGEMMNYPGVIYNNTETINKIKKTLACGKVVDGHAPYVRGEDLKKYVRAGISTDHECDNIEEAKEKLDAGMKILIREGSAARNFDALIGLMKNYSDHIMFCSDDKHPDSLYGGHINNLAKRAVAVGYNVIDVLRVCCMNPVVHYKMNVGMLQIGDNADFIIVDNLRDFNVYSTYIDGVCVYNTEKGYCNTFRNLKKLSADLLPNKFAAKKISPDILHVTLQKGKIHVIGTKDGSITTKDLMVRPKTEKEFVMSDVKRDILKLVVYNRYSEALPQVAFVHGFNIKKGAIASTIAHDSHNIIAVGTDDLSLTTAINNLIDFKGGIVAGYEDTWSVLPLPVAGLMSPEDGVTVAQKYRDLNKVVADMGCLYSAPFMTLSFLALLVIPELKLSDKGLFDSKKMQIVSLFVKNEC